MTIQIIISLIALFVIIKALAKRSNKKLQPFPFILWSIFWLLVIILVWIPNITNYVAAFLQVGRGTDAVLYVSLILIFYILFRIFLRLEKMEKTITELARHIALTRTPKE